MMDCEIVLRRHIASALIAHWQRAGGQAKRSYTLQVYHEIPVRDYYRCRAGLIVKDGERLRLCEWIQ